MKNARGLIDTRASQGGRSRAQGYQRGNVERASSESMLGLGLKTSIWYCQAATWSGQPVSFGCHPGEFALDQPPESSDGSKDQMNAPCAIALSWLCAAHHALPNSLPAVPLP